MTNDKNELYRPINRFERVVVTEKNDLPSKTDQTGINDTNIYNIIEKYGIAEKILNSAQIPISMDLRNMPKNIEELYKSKKQITTYFETLPANVRNYIGTADDLIAMMWSGQKIDNLTKWGIYENETTTKSNNNNVANDNNNDSN